MKIILITIIFLLPLSLIAKEGDKYICNVTNASKSTPLGNSDVSSEFNSKFELEWKKNTLVLDDNVIYDIIVTKDENLFAKQDLEVDFKPYLVPFATVYLVDGIFSLSLHSPDDNFFTISIFGRCKIN